MKKLNLVGAGKVGQTLFRLLAACDCYEIQDVASTSVEKARKAVSFIGKGHAAASIGEMRPADIWFVAVPDRLIAGVASDIATVANSQAQGERPVAVHCSGSLPSSVMEPLAGRGWSLASLHPVMSFASPEAACRQFPGAWCGLEGDAEAKDVLMPLVEAIGGRAFDIASEGKMLYHAAAVFSNNFAVVLQAIARGAWAKAGLPEETVRELNRSMLASTFENLMAVGPGAAITGPAARGDDNVVERQGRQVEEWFPEAGEIYRLMSVLARRLKEQGALP